MNKSHCGNKFYNLLFCGGTKCAIQKQEIPTKFRLFLVYF